MKETSNGLLLNAADVGNGMQVLVRAGAGWGMTK